MTIAPIVQVVDVAVAPARAFSLFTGSMGRWWKPGMHIAPQPFVDVVVEPRDGGRWFERDAEGHESDWGKVLSWEPPGRLLLAWQLDAGFKFDPALITEVEVTFVPEGTGTRVTVIHRDLERLGESAERVAAALSGGWPTLVQLYANFTKGEDQ